MTSAAAPVRLPRREAATPSRDANVLAALVARGVRDRRRAPLTWGGSLGALCALIVAIWPSVQDSIGKAIEGYPEGLKQAFGISELNTIEAYLDAEMFSLIVPLAGAFLAVRIAVGIVVAAEERGWLDTLLAAPVPRRTLMASAFGTAAIVSAAVLLVVAAVSLLTSVVAGTGLSAWHTLQGVGAVWALGVLFAGIACLASGLLRHAAAVTAIVVGTLVAMYVIDVAGKVSDALEPARWASAFKYYGSPLRDGVDLGTFAGFTLIGIACAVAGALLFERRDV